MADNKQLVEGEVEQALALERSLAEATNAMMQNPEFRQFLERQKADQEKIDGLWSRIKDLMIEYDIKSIRSDEWGSLTVAERLNWSVTKELPRTYQKLVPDTKKISDQYRLTGKAPKGASPSVTKYLLKKFKGVDNG